MPQAIKVVIVCSVAHYVAYWILARMTPYGDKLKKYFLASVITIAVSVLSGSILMGYIAALIMALRFNRNEEASVKIAYFFGVAFALSYFNGVALRPGIDLGGISYPRLLIVALLIPIVLRARPDRSIFKYNAIDYMVILYFVWVALLSLRSPSFTGILRINFYLIIDYIFLYIAIRRHLNNYALVLAAISYAILSQSFIGVIEAVLRWHIHTDVERLANFSEMVNAQFKLRGSWLRVQASFLNPLIYSLFANFALLSALMYARQIGVKTPTGTSKLMGLGLIGSTIIAVLASGSRAGIASGVLIIVLSGVLLWAINRKVDPKGMLITVTLVGITCVWIYLEDYIRVNFWYRVQLIEVSWPIILSQPIFGSNVLDSRMEVLRQGEGIIDLVNHYIAIALTFGLPAFFLFIFVIFRSLSKLYNCLRVFDDEKLSLGIFTFISLFIMSLSIATTSVFGWIDSWIWVCIAIASNLIERQAVDTRKRMTTWEKR